MADTLDKPIWNAGVYRVRSTKARDSHKLDFAAWNWGIFVGQEGAASGESDATKRKRAAMNVVMMG